MKHNNLYNLSNGQITYGAYNRKEIESSEQLVADLRLLVNKYRSQTIAMRNVIWFQAIYRFEAIFIS